LVSAFRERGERGEEETEHDSRGKRNLTFAPFVDGANGRKSKKKRSAVSKEVIRKEKGKNSQRPERENMSRTPPCVGGKAKRLPGEREVQNP